MSEKHPFLVSCVTISKYFDQDFVETCYSFYCAVPSEFVKNVQLVAVISCCDQKDVACFLDVNLPKLPVKLLTGVDTSLYNAMNIGLSASSGKYLFFLNAGDFVCSANLMSDLIYHISALQHHRFCYCFSSIQQYQHLRWLRPSLSSKSNVIRQMLPPHQGIIVPNDSQTPLFNESLPLTADSDWIRKVLSVYIPLYSLSPIVIFSLGGLSNAPSTKLISLRLKERSYGILLLELIKFVLFSFLPSSAYYRIIFYFRGLKLV